MTDHKAEPMRGRIIESDFGKDTVTFRMEPPYYVTGGVFLIAPIGGGISLDSLTAASAASEGEDVRLWDSQWVNVVNHANCYEDFTKEEAVAHAVKMTEQYMRSNITAGFPSTRPAAQVAATPKHDEGRGLLPCPFCPDGGAPYLFDRHGHDRTVAVRCSSCGAATDDFTNCPDTFGGNPDAIAAWNRRALATQPAARRVTDEDVEAVERAVGFSARGWDMADPKEIIAAARESFAQPAEGVSGE